MCQGIFLDRSEIEYIILESANEFGGTWRENIYPGAACDVKADLYSLSFEPNPRWTKAWPDQAEILEYMKNIGRKYDLYSRTRFN